MAEHANVGDYIEVTDNTDNSLFFSVKAGGKVQAVDSSCALVAFTHGDYDSDCQGTWWINHGKYKVVKPYSSTFTEPARAEAPQGHTSDGGGLQKHSLGDLYPLCVVGYAKDAHTTVWVVENLQRGQVACAEEGLLRSWDCYADAAEFAELALWDKEDPLGIPIVWVAGRPRFEDDSLILNTH